MSTPHFQSQQRNITSTSLFGINEEINSNGIPPLTHVESNLTIDTNIINYNGTKMNSNLTLTSPLTALTPLGYSSTNFKHDKHNNTMLNSLPLSVSNSVINGNFNNEFETQSFISATQSYNLPSIPNVVTTPRQQQQQTYYNHQQYYNYKNYIPYNNNHYIINHNNKNNNILNTINNMNMKQQQQKNEEYEEESIKEYNNNYRRRKYYNDNRMEKKIIKSEPKWIKVTDLDPSSVGFNLKVKVGDIRVVINRLNVDGSRLIIKEAEIGDETGTILLSLRNDQVDLVKPGMEILLRNGKIDMVKEGFMRVAIDRWGLIDKNKNGKEKHYLNRGNELSTIQYELIKENQHLSVNDVYF